MTIVLVGLVIFNTIIALFYNVHGEIIEGNWHMLLAIFMLVVLDIREGGN